MFEIAFTNVMMTLLYIFPGFLLCKLRRVRAEDLASMSAVLIYVCSPCLIVSSFLSFDFSWERLADMGMFFIVTLLLQTTFMALLFFLFRKKYEDSKYRIFTIGSVMGNVGFFGMPVIKALFPTNPEVMCYSSVYVVSMNVLVFTMGVFCLTKKKEYMTPVKAVLNPSTIALVLALPLFIFSGQIENFALQISFIDVLKNGITLAANMSTPLCMIILGIRLATVPFKKLFFRPFVYWVSIGKLLIFPLFCSAAICLLPFDVPFSASVLILSGTPCASIILNLAEIHHSEMELSANCVLISTLMCFLTIPLLTLLV